MNEGEVSRTALQVAACRAAHLRFDPPPHLLEDRVAEPLLGPEGEALIDSYGAGASWILLENRLFMPFRARFAEDLLAESYRAGTRQLVVLGAGLDSFAFRRPAELDGLRVFEVDHPATQRWKARRVAQLGWVPPDFLRLVACDFEKTTASQALRAAGLRTAEPAVVNWLGVVYYLTRDAVARALADLRGLLAPGSAVVLDYQLPFETLPQRYRDVQARMEAYLGSTGEPQVNRYRPEELRDAILGAGFARADLPARADLERRYFAPLASPIPMTERFGLAIAHC